ncbi:aromatic acid exporter family protein [Bacillus paranthracis]
MEGYTKTGIAVFLYSSSLRNFSIYQLIFVVITAIVTIEPTVTDSIKKD